MALVGHGALTLNIVLDVEINTLIDLLKLKFVKVQLLCPWVLRLLIRFSKSKHTDLSNKKSKLFTKVMMVNILPLHFSFITPTTKLWKSVGFSIKRSLN